MTNQSFTANHCRQSSLADGQTSNPWLSLGVCIFLAVAVWAVFGQTLHHEFVNYDDDRGVYENPAIAHGLSRIGVVWAFTHDVNDNWLPLTVLSHMLDCQFYGLHPAGHHLTNVLLHTATVIALFLVLRNMTGAFWRSAFVAAVFAIHPLRVESVAWVAERKDVLSGFFFMLSIGAYVRYANESKVQSPAAARTLWRGKPRSKVFYVLALLAFALGLMSKPMVVTLPFVLLLLDYWPLGRICDLRFMFYESKDSRSGPVVSGSSAPVAPSGKRKLLLEKMPFFILATLDCVATCLAQRNGIQTFQQMDFPARVGNALASYAVYIKQMIYPAGLAAFYPYPEHLSVWMVGFCVLVLCIVSVGVLAARQEHPYLLAGWLWYLGMLVPVIGLMQVGGQARADRYTYLPQIGLYLMVAWGAVDLCGGWRWRRAVLGCAAAAILAGLLAGAYVQTTYWKNSFALWTHTLDCTSDNHIAYNNLGAVLAGQGKLSEAIHQYKRTIELKPGYATAHNNLGLALAAEGKSAEAISHYERALELKPDYAEAHESLGNALTGQGNLAEAISHYERALELKPDLAEAHYNLGNALARQGKVAEAIAQYERALELKPDYARACYNLGNALARQGKVAEAVQQFERAVQLKPDFAEAYNNLGNALAGRGGLADAVQQFEKAIHFKPDYIEARYNLANALAREGKSAEAIQLLQQALNLATAQNQNSMAEAIRHQISSYQQALPPTQTR